MEDVYLSLGSNIDPEQHLREALRELRLRFVDLTVSPVYRTPAVGFEGPDFLNLAVGLHTEWSPQALNTWLHDLEQRHGRRRDVARYSSRTLDIDIVLYGNRVMHGAGHLELPRPELDQTFVLKPLTDIAPEIVHPLNGRTLMALWRAHPDYTAMPPPEPIELQ